MLLSLKLHEIISKSPEKHPFHRFGAQALPANIPWELGQGTAVTQELEQRAGEHRDSRGQQ